VRDFLNLGFPDATFDAVYALNCLLHVPNSDLPDVLSAIHSVLRPGGLFFLGVYGGTESGEGPLATDEHVPPRFFSWRSDDDLLRFAGEHFDVVDFRVVGSDGVHFQSLTLRRDDGQIQP
jgi:SAM-dependent methyltransferase